ncbi:TIGR03085 family metal-binding protein [Nocardioides bizhenqiangii]|uniref:TIGR03085 family metal-binding protein n=1 Tax=Nocardioides bizhenqiangii TaxID=3095076 RepID=A0ABZ0ZMJ1_9ACTN|nr:MULTISPECIES: TIGR03085 family metal-binding protein [unclassified Nocardioides]MDZ5620606.1 TIGR03085 family metal-binding protein [Nocardioides sp. HM23]WQQ24976.1 TIGR03085 family metal-binding protein [Nocardioides sp. HM61]
MTSFARAERDRLCDLALETGPGAPTLCGDWTVRELMAHLVVRENSPLSVGIVVPPLASITEKETERVARKPFDKLVDKVRKARNPLALPGIDAAVNTAEYFVHHEDVRRAADGWVPRRLEPEEQDALWRVARVSGKGLIRPAGVPVLIRRTDTGTQTNLRAGSDPVVISGLPSEIVLFLYGRRETDGLSFEGPEDRVAKLRDSDLGI